MISVCIATHNGEKYIKTQLLSILQQLSTEDEIVISDDGSTDCTLNIIQSFNDDRIKVYEYTQTVHSNHAHIYVCRNFENALKHAKGDYIFLSDQDDVWLSGKVDECLELLKNNTLVVHNAELVDGDLKSRGKLMYKDEFVFRNFMSLKRGKYYGCTLAFRKELLNAILPFPRHLVLHDHWIGCMAELVGEVYFYNKPLMKYRLHGDNTSSRTKNVLWYKLYYRAYMFIELLAYCIKYRYKL